MGRGFPVQDLQGNASGKESPVISCRRVPRRIWLHKAANVNSSADTSQRFFSNDEQKERSEGSPRLVLTSPKRLDVLIRSILTFALCTELLVPLLLLNKMQANNPSSFQSMGFYQILLIFFATLFFSASCSLFTRARRHEVFASTAAYCAVLVVFLGNSPNVTIVQNTSGPQPGG